MRGNDNSNLIIMGSCILIIIGIIANSIGFALLSKAESELKETNKNSEEYEQKWHWLNHTRDTNRNLSFIGYSAIIFGFMILIASLYYHFNNKMRSLEQKINDIITQQNINDQSNEDAQKEAREK